MRERHQGSIQMDVNASLCWGMNRMPMCPLMPAVLPCDRCSRRGASMATCEGTMLREMGINTRQAYSKELQIVHYLKWYQTSALLNLSTSIFVVQKLTHYFDIFHVKIETAPCSQSLSPFYLPSNYYQGAPSHHRKYDQLSVSLFPVDFRLILSESWSLF